MKLVVRRLINGVMEDDVWENVLSFRYYPQIKRVIIYTKLSYFEHRLEHVEAILSGHL